MFTFDLNAGVVPQMSPPPHDLERLRTNMVDFIVLSIKLVFMVLGVSYSRVICSVYIIMRQLSRAMPGNPASNYKQSCIGPTQINSDPL